MGEEPRKGDAAKRSVGTLLFKSEAAGLGWAELELIWFCSIELKERTALWSLSKSPTLGFLKFTIQYFLLEQRSKVTIQYFKRSCLEKPCSVKRLGFHLAIKTKTNQPTNPQNLHFTQTQTKPYAFYPHLPFWFGFDHKILLGDTAGDTTWISHNIISVFSYI